MEFKTYSMMKTKFNELSHVGASDANTFGAGWM